MDTKSVELLRSTSDAEKQEVLEYVAQWADKGDPMGPPPPESMIESVKRMYGLAAMALDADLDQ